MSGKQRSKFAELLEAARPAEATESELPATPLPPPAAPARGRPPTGKRSDPDFEQATVYIRAATHRRVKMALLSSGERRDFSDLVEELLGEWLRERGE